MHWVRTRPFLLSLLVAAFVSIFAVAVKQQERRSSSVPSATTLSKLAAEYAEASIYAGAELADVTVFVQGEFAVPRHDPTRKSHYRAFEVTVEGHTYRYNEQLPGDSEYIVFLLENTTDRKRSWCVIRIP